MERKEDDEDEYIDSLDGMFAQKGLFGLASTSITPVWNEKQYWNKRYEAEKDERPVFDWYESLDHFGTVLKSQISDKKARIIEVGCGNSELTEKLFEEGYDIIGTDYSDVCVSMMQERVSKKNIKVKFMVVDVRSMPFEAGSFEIVLDKATSDAIYVNGSENNKGDFIRMAEEVERVLTEDGKWIVLTRKIPLSWFPTTFEIKFQQELKETETQNSYFIYVFTKKNKQGIFSK